jgi:undecaprenyl diphosphate synthase
VIIAEDASGIDPARVPAHVACIMDGNGRWAASRGLPRTEGHRAGEEALVNVVDACLELGVQWLTVFAFSTENWARPDDEVHFLMALHRTLFGRRDQLNERGVRVRWIGRPQTWGESRAPEEIVSAIDEAVELTRGNTKMTFTVAFDYGGRAELVDAMRAIARAGLDAGSIDEKVVESYLYDPEMPDVDLLVRTSGEYRISNFLLWKLAYSELVFTDTLWPDFGRLHLVSAILEYQQRHRRKGAL